MSYSNSIGAEALTLSGDEQLPTVKVRASAIFSILTNYIRRNEKSARMIGTLVGTIKEGNIIEVFWDANTYL
jgi:presenilin-like A22 family membrane protease